MEGRSKAGMKLLELLQEDDPAYARGKWAAVHRFYHEQAVLLPLYGKRIPTLMNHRLTGYEAGNQQYDYPVHRLRVASGPRWRTPHPRCPPARGVAGDANRILLVPRAAAPPDRRDGIGGETMFS